MSDSYLDGKVREALKVAKGSRSVAQQGLMVWAMKDARLLQEMARPFLKAITGAAIAAAIKRGVSVPGMSGPPVKPAQPLSKEDLARVLNQLGGGQLGGGSNAGAGDTDADSGSDGLTLGDVLGGKSVPSARNSATVPARTTAKPAPTPGGQASTIKTLAAIYARNRKKS
ncbi:MAG: hypothetical protein WCF85_11310 [Rhodospirillaceae bacterium]